MTKVWVVSQHMLDFSVSSSITAVYAEESVASIMTAYMNREEGGDDVWYTCEGYDVLK